MKKLYAIIISLVFVGSVFGIAPLAAVCTENCDPPPSPTCTCGQTNYYLDKNFSHCWRNIHIFKKYSLHIQ